ncbi:MAG: GGDEF domain-containing protein [Mariprofundaceae bacterium]|nr:GGDEF domain-containing protein [Mariprofundaceae bacterium]
MMNLSVYQKIFLSHFLAIVFVVMGLGTYLYIQAMQNVLLSVQTRLASSIVLLSQSFDASQLNGLRQKKDMDKDVYRKNIQLLREMVKSNPDVVSLYILRRSTQQALFVLDSDSVAMVDTGSLYQAVNPELLIGFYQVSTDVKITSDQWGYFLSGYAPLKNGLGQYLIGMDMRADDVAKQVEEVRYAGLLALLLICVFSLLFAWGLSNLFTRRINVTIKKLHEKSLMPEFKERKGDELDALVGASECIANELYENQLSADRSQQGLQDQLQHLKKHYKEHTHELEESNALLRTEVEQRVKIEKELAKVACTDDLTGLMNRRAMMHICQKLVKQYGQKQQSFCLMLIDIADFKALNQQYGLIAADQMMIQFSDFVRHRLAQQDVIARWSGADFMLVMKEASLDDAQDFAYELDQALNHYYFHAGKVPIQLHMGIGVHRATMNTEDVIQHATLALMQAKQRGSYCAAYEAL